MGEKKTHPVDPISGGACFPPPPPHWNCYPVLYRNASKYKGSYSYSMIEHLKPYSTACVQGTLALMMPPLFENPGSALGVAPLEKVLKN